MQREKHIYFVLGTYVCSVREIVMRYNTFYCKEIYSPQEKSGEDILPLSTINRIAFVLVVMCIIGTISNGCVDIIWVLPISR